ncbi:AHL_G0017690.mRNA.1.CDS.1 [Saccharomyces cerevisiae]|nr:AHL_G0017690.mRNA.1.CDS.1 [Saccharomyces cerevisiae]CAI6650960.1 AHL_G0017690.mRNA.1.CDS.1 [Saccharomyces cerevisiae]
MRSLIFITLVLASIALALDVIEKSKTITVSTNYHEKLTIEKGVYLGLVGGSFHNFYSDVKVHGGLYVSTDDSSIRKNNRLVGNFENYFNTVIDLKRDTVSNSYIWEGESFENMGNMSMRGTPFASSNSQSLTFSYFSNSGFLQFVDTGYLQFGKEDGTLINTGTIAAQSDQFNHIYLIPQSSMMGNGCLWVGGYCIFHIEDLDNISVEDQTIVLSSEPNAIVLGGFTDPPSRHPPVTSLKIRNFNSKTSIWFHDNNPKIKSFENGILTVTTIGRKYILDVGPGYTGDQFSMTNTPVTTQLWQEGRPINAGVLRTTKVKPTLSAYPGCLPPQSIPDFNSFKTLPFRDAESLPNGRTTVTSSRISSSVVGSLSKTIITTSISSSTADNQHVDVSSNFPSRTASETATVFFSFSSSDYSSQPSDYIASASSGIDGQTVTKPTGYTFLDSSSQPSSYVTSGLDTTSYQSSLDGSQSVNVLSNFTTKVSSYSTLISSDTTFAQYTSGVLSTSNSLSSNDAISRFTETTTQSISSSSQYFSNYVDQLSNEVTVIPLTTTTSQSTGEVVAQSSGYVFSLLSGNNTQLTSKEALSTSFDSSVATKFATLSTYKQSSDYLNSETATAPPFLSSSTISFPGSGEFKSHSLNQSLSVTNLLSSSQTAFGGNSLGQFKSQTPSGSSTTVAPQPGSPTLTLLSSSTAAENSAPKEALSPTSFPDMTTRVSGGATPNVSTVTSLLTDSADDEHTSTITQISSFSDNSDINIATPSLSCSSNQFSKHASPSPISNIVTQWESTPDSPSLCTITSACSSAVITVHYSNLTQYAASTLAAEYFTRSSPTSFESGNSRSTLDSVKTDLMSFSNQPSSNPSITTSSQVSTGITTSVSASSQPSSGSLIASSSEISTSTTPLTSSTSQPLSDSSIIFPSQVSTGTTTSVSASSKFSHTLTTDSPTDIVSKSSDIPSPSSSNTVTTVSHSNNTQHASSTLAAEYFIRGSSSFLESDSSMFALQSTYTSLLSVSNQPSGDSRIPSSSQISTDITTLTSSISEISHTVATESLTNSASQPSSRTAIEVFIRSGRESSSAVAPRTSNIISGPSSSTYSLSSRDNILYSSTILVPFASSDLLESLKKNSSGSVASSGQSSALSVHSTLTDPTLVNPPMQSSRILTTKSASHIVSYSLTLSTFDSLNKGNTVIPIHPTVEKLASSTVSTSRHGSTSASHISDSQYLNKANYTTAQQVVQSSSLSSFEPNISNSFSTLTTFTTIYKEWTGTFISTYSTQVSTLNVNKARMVERAVGDSGSRVTIEIIYYVETPKANEALLTINANNGAASSQTIGNIATVTSCSSYVYTGVVSPAVISTVTTKIGDAITELTTWCPFSMPDSADKTIETFVTSSLLNVHTDLASTTTKHTSVPTANSNTVTKDMTLRPSFGTELVFGTTRGTDIAVTLESIKTAIPQNTTPGTKTHESSPSPASKATTPTTYGSAAVIIPEFSVSSTNVPSSESSLVTVQSGLTTSFMNSPRSWSYSSSVIASNSTSFQLSRYAGTANNLVSNGLWSVFVSTVLLAFYR